MFAEFDHDGAAAEVGMDLPGTHVIGFGSPRAGTPLMQADPRVGIELPLRVLVWEQSGEIHLGHADPRAWDGHYDLGSQTGVLEAMAGLLARLVGEAAGTEGR